MNLLKFIGIVLFAILSSSLFFPVAAQNPAEDLSGTWNITLRHYTFGEMRSTLVFKFHDQSHFFAHSHKKGVSNLVGGFKASMAKVIAKKPMMRTGAFLNMEKGSTEIKDGKVVFSALLDMVVSKNIRCQGTLENGQLRIPLTNSKGKNVGIIEGTRATQKGPLDDYPSIVTELLATFDRQIYDRKVLTTKEWKTFAKKMIKIGKKAQDDVDLVFAFSNYAEKLPFSHKLLFRTEQTEGESDALKSQFSFRAGQVSLEEKSPETVVLRIRSFRCPGRDVDSVMQIVLAKNYQNLIVDIRGNGGGALEGGLTLGQYLVREETETGVYLTQKWFNEHTAPPSAQQLREMPAFTTPDVLQFLKELDEKGFVVLKAKPGSATFTGKVYLLTDRGSASACEPLAWNLKHSGHVTLVGEPTAGAMLSASTYPIRNGFQAVIPNGDYYTPDGNRLDLVGVTPHIQVKSEEALEYVLQELINK